MNHFVKRCHSFLPDTSYLISTLPTIPLTLPLQRQLVAYESKVVEFTERLHHEQGKVKATNAGLVQVDKEYEAADGAVHKVGEGLG